MSSREVGESKYFAMATVNTMNETMVKESQHNEKPESKRRRYELKRNRSK